MQGLSQVLYDILAPFPPGGDHAPNAAERGAALRRAKAARDLYKSYGRTADIAGNGSSGHAPPPPEVGQDRRLIHGFTTPLSMGKIS